LVRMILLLSPSLPPFDIHLDGYERAGNGWLATKIVMYQNGKPSQSEEHADGKVGMDLDAALFDPAKWNTVRHWKTGQPTAPPQSTDPLNLDFERGGLISPIAPAKWGGGGAGYTLALDSVAPNTGARSLRIRPGPSIPPNGFGVFSTPIPGSVIA